MQGFEEGRRTAFDRADSLAACVLVIRQLSSRQRPELRHDRQAHARWSGRQKRPGRARSRRRRKRVRSGQAHRARRTHRLLETCFLMLQAVGCRKHADLRDENQTRARELESDRRYRLNASHANEEGSRRGRTAFDDSSAAPPPACFNFSLSNARRAPTCQMKAHVKASAGAVRCCSSAHNGHAGMKEGREDNAGRGACARACRACGQCAPRLLSSLTASPRCSMTIDRAISSDLRTAAQGGEG